MISNKTILKNADGLHARPASILATTANKYKCNITLVSGDKTVNAKSVLNIMSAGLKGNSEIIIECDGEDEEIAMQELLAKFENEFGE